MERLECEPVSESCVCSQGIPIASDKPLAKDAKKAKSYEEMLEVITRAVSSVVDSFQAVKKQLEAFQQFIPRRVHQAGPSTSRPVPISRREELKGQ